MGGAGTAILRFHCSIRALTYACIHTHSFSLPMCHCPKLELPCKQLAGVNRPIALAQANAILNRIDLLCEVFSNLLIIFLLQYLHGFFICCSF